MLRTRFVVVVALLALVAGIMAVPSANAQTFVPGFSFPAWDKQTTEVQAGITPRVTFHEEYLGPETGYWKGMANFLEIPVGGGSYTASTKWMCVDPLILGIKPEFLLGVKVEVDDTRNLAFHEGKFWFNLEGLHSSEGMLHEFVISVKQNQGRRDEGGLIPKVLQIFGRKTHRQVTATDQMAALFGTYDVGSGIARYCRTQMATTPEAAMANPDAAQVVKTVIYGPLTQVMRIQGIDLDYSIVSQGFALQTQGFAPPMAQGQQSNPEVEAYKAQVSAMQDQIRALNEALNSIRQQLAQPQADPAPAPATPSTTAPTVAPQPAPVPVMTQEQSLLQQFAGDDVYVLALDERSSVSQAQVTFWALNDTGWHSKQLVVSRDNVQFVRYANLTGYREIGLSQSPDERPEKTLTPTPGAHILMIKGGG